MRRIVSVLFAFITVAYLSLTVVADMGAPYFENWVVVCGTNGYTFQDEYWDETTEEYVPVEDYVEPGIKLTVISFYEGKYSLQIDDERHQNKGSGYFSVSETDLDKYFVGEKKVIAKLSGEDLEKNVKCVVIEDGGLNLRQGPGAEYPSFGIVPQNTTLTYRYVYEVPSNGLKWGYVTYKGKEGWLCIDYTKKIDETAVPTTTPEEDLTEETTQVQTTVEADQTTVSTTVPITVPETIKVAETEAVENESGGFFSNTRNIIVVCCVGAVILAMSAVVVLLILKQHRKQ